jgi:hypothetical protein
MREIALQRSALFVGAKIYNVDSEDRAHRVAAQKQSGGQFLDRGLYVCSHREKMREIALRCSALFVWQEHLRSTIVLLDN